MAGKDQRQTGSAVPGLCMTPKGFLAPSLHDPGAGKSKA
jgi:hypothetical protein